MKVGQKSSDSRLPKPPKPPEKPLMPYMRYSRKVWESVKNANPQLKLWEVGKIIGQMWRELPENEKSHFVEEYENDKIQYNDALRLYHNSPAYKSWLLHKEKVEKSVDDNDSVDGGLSTQSFKSKDRMQKEAHMVETRESYILEDNDEDPDEVFTTKHVAVQRFHRNQKLLLELFSDFKVPDLGTFVTESRLNALKQQVEGLINHKRKLDDEIEESQNKHESKKLKIKTESEKFWTEYSKELEARPVITEKMFTDMVKKARDDMIREEKEREEIIKSRLNMNETKPDPPTERKITKPFEESPAPTPVSITVSVPTATPSVSENLSSHNTPISNGISKQPRAFSQPPISSQSVPSIPSTNYSESNQYGIAQSQHLRNPVSSYESRTSGLNHGFPVGNFPPHGQSPSQQQLHSSRSNMVSPSQQQPHHQHQQQMLEPETKLSKANCLPDSMYNSNNIEKDVCVDFKSKQMMKDPGQMMYPLPKSIDTSVDHVPMPPISSKAPILSPEITDSDVKGGGYSDHIEQPPPPPPPASLQSPKKTTTKKRKPPSKPKNAAISHEMDGISSSSRQMVPDDLGVGGMSSVVASAVSHISPSKMGGGGSGGGGPMVDSGYGGADPNSFPPPHMQQSMQQQQQGIYPYHYYPPQFVPHPRGPSPYASYQPGYYGQVPQPSYRPMGGHPMQPDIATAVNQYGMPNKPLPPPPPSQPYGSHSYGPGGPYSGYGPPQYASSAASGIGGSQQMQDMQQQPPPQQQQQIHPVVSGSKEQQSTTGGGPSGLSNQMGMSVADDPTGGKYPGGAIDNMQVSSGGPIGSQQQQQMHGSMPPPTYPTSQYPGLPYSSQPPPVTGSHYPNMPGHYFYYPPPGPQSHGGQNASDQHSFWSHHHHQQQQSSGYPPMGGSGIDGSGSGGGGPNDNQPQKVQE